MEENIPHEVSEFICLKCFHRWLGVYPENTLLKDLQCPCGEVGYVIKTGQTLPKENQCDTCKLLVNGKCKLGLSGNDYCEYKKG